MHHKKRLAPFDNNPHNMDDQLQFLESILGPQSSQKVLMGRQGQAQSAKAATHSKLIEALALQQQGFAKQAMALLLEVLKSDPGNLAALYSLGALEDNAGNHAAGLGYISRAISSRPDFAQAYLARSVIHLHLGKPQEALSDVDQALRLQSDLASAQSHRQFVLHSMQTNATVEPTGVAKLNFLALQAQGKGDAAQAAELFTQVVGADPGNFVALYSLGVIANQQGKTSEALGYLRSAVESNPGNAQGHFALATTLQSMALYEAALATFDRSLEIDPNYLEAYNNKATLLHSMGRQKDALLTLEAATAVSPTDAKTLGNRGYLLTEFKKNAAAADVFRQLLDADPGYDYAEGLHAYARLHSCDWRDFEENRTRIVEGIRAGKRVCNPLAFMALSDSAADQRRCAEIFSAHRFPEAREALWRGETYLHRKKRVAFLSADFREHPVGYLLIGMLENLDKRYFETIGISMAIRDGSELYSRYRNTFDHYLDCADKTALETARIMRAMEVDIAIDLSGYTSGSRIDILSHRPAPVQMTYLGFPGTLGTSYIDYLIADRIIVPPSAQGHYSEKIIYLPHCYLPRDTGVKPAPTTPPRADFGLPETGVVFCSFNHDYKINPAVFSVWMDLLREVPDSVLWLMKLNEDARANLAQSAAAHGVDPDRIVFATRVPRVEDHLARYRHADVFLDTFPYNGHTTAGDALLAGVPVVTLAGNSFASRVATSLLNDVGMPTWSCADMASYRTLAKSLALDGREEVRQALQARLGERWPISEKTQAQAFGELLAGI